MLQIRKIHQSSKITLCCWTKYSMSWRKEGTAERKGRSWISMSSLLILNLLSSTLTKITKITAFEWTYFTVGANSKTTQPANNSSKFGYSSQNSNKIFSILLYYPQQLLPDFHSCKLSKLPGRKSKVIWKHCLWILKLWHAQTRNRNLRWEFALSKRILPTL